MSKLTDAQLMILSKASQRDDHAIEFPLDVKGGGDRAVAALTKRGLIEEVQALPGMPIWRQDESEAPKALVITSAALEALGIETTGRPGAEELGIEPADSAVPAAGAGTNAPPPNESCEGATASDARSSGDTAANPPSRRGSKIAEVTDLLRREQGASIEEIIAVTGWLPHTTRAALTGLRKRGFELSREQRKGEPTIYRIVAAVSGAVTAEGDASVEAASSVGA